MRGTKHKETKRLYKTPYRKKKNRQGLTHMELNTSPNHQPTLRLKTLCLNNKTSKYYLCV